MGQRGAEMADEEETVAERKRGRVFKSERGPKKMRYRSKMPGEEERVAKVLQFHRKKKKKTTRVK